MASLVIHMAIASEINKKINRNYSKLIIGTIAPDISKLINESKTISHFFDSKEEHIPNLERFLNKYKNKLDDDFVMGYYIHLYTDYLWEKYFIEELNYRNIITRLDGSSFIYDKETFVKYLYNDYTNVNIKLIDRYNLELDIFYNKVPRIEHIIEEIPMDKLSVVINNTANIITNSKINKSYLFDIDNVITFINLSCKLIISELEKNNK